MHRGQNPRHPGADHELATLVPAKRTRGYDMRRVLARIATLTVCIRKAFGLAWQAMNGAGQASIALYAWPSSEIGFMDPAVGVNVAFGSRLAAIAGPGEREAQRQRLTAEVAEGTTPYDAAGTMRLDEIIDPAETRPERMASRKFDSAPVCLLRPRKALTPRS